MANAANSSPGPVGREDYWQELVGDWRAEVERAQRAGRAPVTVREFCRSYGLRGERPVEHVLRLS